ncbi:NAD-dependent epimerase/dehydratase family protein [Pontixanthobacter gangjinensis]|uniref:NAD(P)H-binding protein n=1 Tax=Pontixanthobacter gangjinensis TaxID=1028742 RepID=A0A6I4SKN4_9SPHN|nr:NAD(P)H-binding protein [Pontixanthobacter gangjinensis]MXO56451.1 NAD(P)H-binding protein [Pontixanthobacter gangjinensis]
MTVAITGGTGFVGQAVLDVMAEKGIPVRALARTVPTDRNEVEWIAGSLSDRDALGSLTKGVDVVIHIAGLTNTPDPAQFEIANVTGTAALIDATKAADIKRFIFVSSLSARKPDLSAYGASKLAAEKLVEASGLEWTIVRPPGVYGPRDVDYLDMFKAARLGVVPLPPGGASSMIHVDDLASLLIALVSPSPKIRRKVFEPDDGREGGWSHKEMAAAIGDAFGRRVLAPHLPKSVLLGAAKIDRLIRRDKAKLTADRVGYMCHPNWVSRSDRAIPPEVWMPAIATPEGLKSTVDWYRQKGWL